MIIQSNQIKKPATVSQLSRRRSPLPSACLCVVCALRLVCLCVVCVSFGPFHAVKKWYRMFKVGADRPPKQAMRVAIACLEQEGLGLCVSLAGSGK